MPPGLQVIARALPLTYSVEALRVALVGSSPANGVLDLVVLAAFTVVLFALWPCVYWRNGWTETMPS